MNLQARRTLLIKIIIPEQIHLVIKLLNKSGMKKAKETSLKIAELSEKIIEFIADAFIMLAKFEFRASFLQWYHDFKLVSTDSTVSGPFDNIAEKKKEMIQSIEQTLEMRECLVDFIKSATVINYQQI